VSKNPQTQAAPLSPRFPPLPRLVLGAAVAAACLLIQAQAARLALVVGNDNYTNVSKLSNARNDAQSIARELQAAGFAVTRVLDATRDSMNDSYDVFMRKIDKGDEVVFYFSGHGVQPPQLGPYLLPVDIKASDVNVVRRDGLSLDQLLADLNKRARFAMIILDACRNNPFPPTTFGRSMPPGSSLSNIEPPRGTMVIMAASRGQEALDRLGRNDTVPNGVFTRELIKHMRTPGLSAGDMVKRVKLSVEQAAASVNHEQWPAVQDETRTDFFFHPTSGRPSQGVASPAPAPAPLVAPPAPAPAPAPVFSAPPPPSYAPAPSPAAVVRPATPSPAVVTSPSSYGPQREFDDWEAAVKAGTRAALERFVSSYPEGRYTPQARVKIAGMAAAPAPAPAPVAAPKPTAAHNPQAEFELWDRAATSKRRADYEAYLATYPNGRYVDLARAALQKL
jgi:hypothetical protein